MKKPGSPGFFLAPRAGARGRREWESVTYRDPGAPAQGYFRFAISSEHDPEQLGSLIGALGRNRGRSE